MLLPDIILLRSGVTLSSVFSVPPLSFTLTVIPPLSVPTLQASNDTLVGLNLWPAAGVTPNATLCPAVADDTCAAGRSEVKAGLYVTAV